MRTPITKEVERQLQEQLARASAGETRVFNPITFEQIMRHRRGSRKHMIDNLRGSAAFNSFSEEEQALILQGKSGQDWLRWLLQVRTVGLALLMVLVWAILSDAGHFLVSSIHSRKKRIAFKYTTLMLGCVMAMYASPATRPLCMQLPRWSARAQRSDSIGTTLPLQVHGVGAAQVVHLHE